MHGEPALLAGLEAGIVQLIHAVGTAIELFGVFVVVAGIGWASWRFTHRRMAERHYDAFRTRVGRSLLLGLEILVAADIVKSVAIELNVTSLAVLAGLVGAHLPRLDAHPGDRGPLAVASSGQPHLRRDVRKRRARSPPP